jgi:hypothetical protein
MHRDWIDYYKDDGTGAGVKPTLVPRGTYLEKIRQEVEMIGAHVIAFEDMVVTAIENGRRPMKSNPYAVMRKQCAKCGDDFEVVGRFNGSRLAHGEAQQCHSCMVGERTEKQKKWFNEKRRMQRANKRASKSNSVA